MIRTGIVAICLVAAPAIASGPTKIGTWRLDIVRSTLPGAVPAADIRTYEDAGNGLIRSTHVTTGADGAVTKTIYTAREDGKDYPMTDAAGHDAGSIAITRRGPLAQDFVTKRDGKVSGSGTTTLSADGRTLTMVIALVGRQANIVTIFNRAD